MNRDKYFKKLKGNKKQLTSALLAIFTVLIIGYGVLYYLPLDIFTIQAKPRQSPQKMYDYYIIIDRDSGERLMYVPLIVTVGDQLISEDNKCYVVIEIQDNFAYARVIKDTIPPKFKK